MKILEVQETPLAGVKIISFARFGDGRGYFSGLYRASDLAALEGRPDLQKLRFVEASESRSRAGVVRGLHLQWNPCMGKLIRPLAGRVIDMLLDLRKGSPTLGRIILLEMKADFSADSDQWIWAPPGLAHGNFYPEAGAIEYFCTGEHNPACEASIAPLAPDLDWSLADPALAAEFKALVAAGPILSDKDRQGLSLAAWLADARSDNFLHSSGD